MKASELRIGNYVFIPSKNKVYQISSGHDIEEIDDSGDAVGIPITEQWLINFGFLRGGYESLTVSKGNFELHGDCPADYPGEEVPPLAIRYNGKIDVYVTHVHQLQNLFFALIGEELYKNQ